MALRRINSEEGSRATLNQAASAAAFHGGKAHTSFQAMIRKLIGK